MIVRYNLNKTKPDNLKDKIIDISSDVKISYIWLPLKLERKDLVYFPEIRSTASPSSHIYGFIDNKIDVIVRVNVKTKVAMLQFLNDAYQYSMCVDKEHDNIDLVVGNPNTNKLLDGEVYMEGDEEDFNKVFFKIKQILFNLEVTK